MYEGVGRTLIASAHRWWEIIKLLPVAGYGLVVVGGLVNVAIGALPLGFLVGTSVMVERVPEIAATVRGGQSHWAPVLVALVLSVTALVLQNLFTPAQAALGELVTRRVDGNVSRRLMRAALALAPMEVLDSEDVLDKLSEARDSLQESSLTPGSAVAGLLALIARYTQLLGAVLIVALVLGPVWGAVICVSALVARVGNRGGLTRWSLTMRGWARGVRRRMRYVYDCGIDVRLAKEMRLLGMLGWWTGRADQESNAFHARLWRERRQLFFAPFLFFTALVLAGTVATLVALEADATGGRLDVLRFVLAVQAVLIPLRFGVFFPEADVQTQYGMVAWEAMREVEERFSSGGKRHTGSLTAEQLPRRSVRFEGVSFAYPGSERLVLDRLDLELPAGTSTAIVGFNGAGKTTAVKLLACLYHPSAGRITVDGTDLSALDMRSWQRRLAVIFQDFVRYELDAATNISFGAPRLRTAGGGDLDDGTDLALRQAADAGGASDIIASLPERFATLLSSRYTGGVDLSGGQWQRIALARALYRVKAGASVLVLDEPTAQLDVRAEVAFFDRFLDLTEGLTTLVISHRFSTVRRAQRIVVLEHGRVAEQGTHDELLSLGGRYAELFDLQARRFTAGETEPDQELDG